jgi:hypothetical protein
VLLHSVDRRSPPETAGEVPQHETVGVNAGDRFDLGRRLMARHRNGDDGAARHLGELTIEFDR